VWAESVVGQGSRFRCELPGAEEGRKVFANGASPPVLKPTPFGGTPRTTPQRASVTRELPAVGRAIAERRRKTDTAPVLQPTKDEEWSTTGSLPPLRAPGRRESGPATGELPPIR
jgi:hypothetical protein